MAFLRAKRFEPHSQIVLLCVAESVPLLWIHLSYSLLEDFDQHSSFAIDKTIVRAIMVTLMEVVVVGIYLAIGFLTSNASIKTKGVKEGSLNEKDLDKASWY
jgi:hypothetical protein